MILIRLRAKEISAGLYSLRFMRSDVGSLAVWEGKAGWLFGDSSNHQAENSYHYTRFV